MAENKEYVWQAARRKAKEVLQDIMKAENGVIHYPIDIENYITDTLKISVKYQPLERKMSGYIHKPTDTSKVEIVINSLDIPARRRFTLAHELGHYLDREEMDDLSYTFIDRRGGEYNINEFYADEFAGALLMPSTEIFRLLDLGCDVEDMAEYFGVSKSAMIMRMHRLVESND